MTGAEGDEKPFSLAAVFAEGTGDQGIVGRVDVVPAAGAGSGTSSRQGVHDDFQDVPGSDAGVMLDLVAATKA